MEEWRKIPGFSAEYEVSSHGHVRRLAASYETTFKGRAITRSKPPKLCALGKLSSKGYPRVNLAGCVYFVHRLIAMAFLQNPQGLPQINHRNGVKTDNRPANIEWCTNQQNRDHAVDHGLHATGPKPNLRKYNPEQVAEFITLYQSGLSLREVARRGKMMHTSLRKMFKREGVPLRVRSEAQLIRARTLLAAPGPAAARSTE